SNQVSYVNAVVTATRADETSPLYVSGWIPNMDMDGGSVVLLLNIKVNAGPSEGKPYGDFHLSFAFFPDMDTAISNGTVNESAAVGKGELFTVQSGTDVGFNFIMQKSGSSLTHELGGGGGGGPSISPQQAAAAMFQETASVLTSTDGATGTAITQRTITGLPNTLKQQLKTFASEMFKAYGLAYNNDNVLVGKSNELSGVATTNNKQCLSRNNFNEAVWRYGLYDAASGAEVQLNSGFPFRYSSSNDGHNDAFGYVGYWGLWTEDQNANLDGKVITKQTFDNGNPSQDTYTLHVKPGRLVKKTVQTLALTELGDTSFDYNDMSSNYRVKYKFGGTADAGFYQVASVTYGGNGGPTETPLCGDSADAASCAAYKVMPQQYQTDIFMYSQQLGGGVRWKLGADKIIFYKEEYVSELDNALDLVCYNQCPHADLTPSSTWDQAYTQAVDWSSFPATVNPVLYTFPKT
ncbi:MAG TPA: hypothetical protein VFM46_12735, partial [Pseudomonadales bacterium]|nr:hypothetical protein [Pseudomonadales bacterium]